jgi:hypothetical protein
VTPPPAYHVYLKSSIHQAAVRWWNSLNVPLPPTHQHNTRCPVVGVVHDAIETDEWCVPGDWIVNRLVDGRRAHLQKVRQISRITLTHDAALGRLRIRSVEVVMNDGTGAVFEPKTLLLCAGHANQALLDPAIWDVPTGHTLPAAFTRSNPIQEETPLDMIVASGPTGTLPVFKGSVAGGDVRDKTNQLWNVRAFVVSRTDLSGNTVWIASGRVDRFDSVTQQPLRSMTGRDFRWMLVNFLAKLFSFNPAHPRMVWGVYPARLTTWLRKPDDLSSRTFVNLGIEGLLVCYTDRLTITPLAADEIEQEVSLKLRPNWSSPGVALPRLPPRPVAVHPEYWRTPARWEHQTSWPWAAFQANCL